MSSEHKRPLYAFAIVAMLCAFFVGSGLRSDAVQGLLRVAEIPISMELIERTSPAPDVDDAVEAERAQTPSPLLSARPQAPMLPATKSRAPQATPGKVTPAVASQATPEARPAVAKDNKIEPAVRPGEGAKTDKGKHSRHTSGKHRGHLKDTHRGGNKHRGWNKGPAHPHGERGHSNTTAHKSTQNQAWRPVARRAQASDHRARARNHQTSQRWSQGRKSARHTSSVRSQRSSRTTQTVKVGRGQVKKSSVRIQASKSKSHRSNGHRNRR